MELSAPYLSGETSRLFCGGPFDLIDINFVNKTYKYFWFHLLQIWNACRTLTTKTPPGKLFQTLLKKVMDDVVLSAPSDHHEHRDEQHEHHEQHGERHAAVYAEQPNQQREMINSQTEKKRGSNIYMYCRKLEAVQLSRSWNVPETWFLPTRSALVIPPNSTNDFHSHTRQRAGNIVIKISQSEIKQHNGQNNKGWNALR